MATRRPNEFEKAFQNLEKIVQRLEGEEMPLDESLQLFEEGIRLSRFCHQRLEGEELPLDEALRLFEEGIGLSRFCHQKLEEVEKKIEVILADAKGEPRTEPFEAETLEDGDEEDAATGEGL